MVGLDIGSQWTKIVWTGRNLLGKVDWCCLKVPTRAPSDDTTVVARDLHEATGQPNAQTWARRDFQLVAEQLRTALRNAGIRGVRRIASNVSMAWCDVRSLDNDGTATQNSQKNIQDRFLETVTDGQVHCVAALPRSSRERTSDSNESFDAQRVLSLPERLAIDLSEAFEEQHLELSTLDGTPWCLARALSQVAQPQALELMLDWGHRSTTLVACHNNQLLHCRKLECAGFSSVISGLQQELELSEREALRLLHKPIAPGTPGAEARRASDALQTLLLEHANQVSKQLAIALRFLAWRLPQSPLKRIWICGGGSQLPPVIEQLASNVGLPVEPWRWSPDAGAVPLEPDMAIASALVRWVG